MRTEHSRAPVGSDRRCGLLAECLLVEFEHFVDTDRAAISLGTILSRTIQLAFRFEEAPPQIAQFERLG